MALLDLAHRLTVEPATIARADIERLRNHGFTDEGITTAVEVIAFFNYINRIAEGLGAPMESWIDSQGRPL